MKIRKLSITNVRSFLSRAELKIENDISIVIGPNGGGKTNLLDILFVTIRRHFLRSFHFPLEGNPPSQYMRVSDLNSIPMEKHENGQSC